MANSGPNGGWLCGPSPEEWEDGFQDVTGWSIYYVDGHRLTCQEVHWEDAPKFGIAAVYVYHQTEDRPNTYKTCIAGHDEYTMKGETATKLGKQVGPTDDSPEWSRIQKWYQQDCETIFPTSP